MLNGLVVNSVVLQVHNRMGLCECTVSGPGERGMKFQCDRIKRSHKPPPCCKYALPCSQTFKALKLHYITFIIKATET